MCALKKTSQQHFPSAKLNLIRCFYATFSGDFTLYLPAPSEQQRNKALIQKLSSFRKVLHMQASQEEQDIFTYCHAVTQNTAGLALLCTHTQRNSRRGSQRQIEAAFKVWCAWTRSVYITLLSNGTHTHTHPQTGTHTHMFGGLWVQLSLQRRYSKLDLLGTAGLHYY